MVPDEKLDFMSCDKMRKYSLPNEKHDVVPIDKISNPTSMNETHVSDSENEIPNLLLSAKSLHGSPTNGTINKILRLKQQSLEWSSSSSSSSSLSSPPNHHQPRYAHGLGSLQFPNGMSPVVARMCIYAGNSLADARAPSLPVACFYGNCFLECLEVLRENNVTSGIKFLLVTEGNVQGKLVDPRKKSVERIVRFGDSVQDVVSALGCPSRQFFKSEDKMKIHLPDAHKHVRAHSADYFFNYFTMGVDILFDAVTHTVKKFVLHTNYPGEYNFNIYCRCEFKLPIVVEPNRVGQAQTIVMEDDLLVITAYSKWDEVQKVLMTPKQRPVILNRSASTNTSNPFGSTFCYGVQDLIFEVMTNQHIASVTVYQSSLGLQTTASGS
ncbi:hypothetical protein RRG08_035915 [Elysia crispata]|uniref:Uncharacterized protein n=1 Tax=Elysia crispata TaxID=231223 RepID=A0AAE1DR82_9GAST|nr:hypothetical protein RRG08_035915 [Elysia crispata]